MREAMLEALPRLRRFARGMTGNTADADDLVQATVERALERPVPEGADVAGWMFKVCKNLWIDELRARAVRRAPNGDGRAGFDEPAQSDAHVIDRITLHEVDRALAELNDDQRVVLVLVAVDGMSYKEAAEVLDTPIGTIMSRLARARKALAAALEADSHADVTSSGR